MVRDLLFGRAEEWFANELRGLEPWMAFLAIWTRYRSSSGWTYTLDVDAEQIARELGKDVRHFETIAEQIEALSGIPLDRIVSFLALGRLGGVLQAVRPSLPRRRPRRPDLGGARLSDLLRVDR